jgi:hypothetical protein
MRSKRAVAAAVAAVCLTGLGAVPLAMAGDTVATSVESFSWTDADGDTDHFDGRISSDEKQCVKDRRVSLYRKESGRDPKIAGATTDRHGEFAVEREDPGSGRYYLKVKRAEVGAITCKRAQTGLLQVTDLDGV